MKKGEIKYINPS